MKIRQKFILLAGVIGALMAIVSIIGYYTANKNLNESVEQELTATMNSEANDLSGWLREKKAAATYGATVLSGYNGDMARIQDPKASALHVNDKDILEFTVGTPSYNHSYYAGDGSKPAPSRPWYQKAVSEGKTVFTEVYEDSNTKKPVVSAAAPIRNGGETIGAGRVDISLDTLNEQIQNIKYHDEGTGYIIDTKGVVLAATGETQPSTSLWEGKDGWAMHKDDIETKDRGYYVVDFEGQKYVDTFVKVPETGWVICLSIPYEKVFGAVSGLRMAYIVLTLIGLARVVLACGMFSRRITVPTAKRSARSSTPFPASPSSSRTFSTWSTTSTRRWATSTTRCRRSRTVRTTSSRQSMPSTPSAARRRTARRRFRPRRRSNPPRTKKSPPHPSPSRSWPKTCKIRSASSNTDDKMIRIPI